MKNLDFENVKLTGGFWKFYLDLDREKVVHSVYDRFLETGRFDALNCNWKEGDENKPHIFWDSDIAKWIEGAAYLLCDKGDEHLEALIDEMVERIAKNQRSDGYFNSYFLAVEPEEVFQRRPDHELYCAGHFIEAAIAYHKATGKDKLLNCMKKYADLIYRVFAEEDSAAFVTPGHEEIELALLKLYDYTHEERYLDLAGFFLDKRGNNNKDSENTRKSPVYYDDSYYQSHIPVRQMTEATGHSVRACYLYTAMAAMAKKTNDEDLLAACRKIFEDIVTTKLSITGGIGAEHKEESFSYKYNLPNRDTYNETCAAIALAMFAGEMQETEVSSRYGDLIERIYFNGFISGVSLSGEEYFYSNPLEIDRKKYAHSTYQTWCRRQKSFFCSCCPPNIVRMLASIPRYTYTVNESSIYCNQFMSSESTLNIGGKKATLIQKTDYPFEERISFEYHGEPATLYVRIPDWCTEYPEKTENGYAKIEICDGECAEVILPMKVHFIEANPLVQDNSGRYAVQYGPLVYCLEEIDNGESLRDITLFENGNIEIRKENLPAPVIYMDGCRRKRADCLYRQKSEERIPLRARLIPYFAFANRDETDMIVWVQLK